MPESESSKPIKIIGVLAYMWGLTALLLLADRAVGSDGLHWELVGITAALSVIYLVDKVRERRATA